MAKISSHALAALMAIPLIVFATGVLSTVMYTPPLINYLVP
jgi:uncharacterized membrane protein